MRRVQAILVMVALLATPLALLARTVSPAADCDMVCCPVNRAHSTPMQNEMHHETSTATHCRHAASMDMDCCMESGRNALPYGLLALMAPTKPYPHATLTPPSMSLRFFAATNPSTPRGPSTEFFEPPRS
ncbi:MAG: hypothetical protein ACRD4M_11880 [Candidatus Acidiferrales bacterium]